MDGRRAEGVTLPALMKGFRWSGRRSRSRSNRTPNAPRLGGGEHSNRYLASSIRAARLPPVADLVAAIAPARRTREVPRKRGVEQRRRARGRRARVIEGNNVMNRDELPPGREAANDRVGQHRDLVRREIVGEFGSEDPAPSSARQTARCTSLPEPYAGIGAKQASGG